MRSHCNTVYHNEYAMNAKTQQQAISCVWAWISNKKNTLNKYKHSNIDPMHLLAHCGLMTPYDDPDLGKN